jgi:hypothetical protein
VALSEITWRRVIREELRQLRELVEGITTCPAELQMCRSDLDRCRADLAWCAERIREVVPVATPPMPFAKIIVAPADVQAEIVPPRPTITIIVAPADVQAETGIGIFVSVETRVE